MITMMVVVAMAAVVELTALAAVAVVFVPAAVQDAFDVCHYFEVEYYKYDSFQDNYHHFLTRSETASSSVLTLKKSIVTSKKNTLFLQQH